MKKTFILVMLAVLLATTGCSEPVDVPYPEGSMLKEKLLNIDIGKSYEHTTLWHHIQWKGNGYLADVSVLQSEDFEEIKPGEEIVKYGEREFLLQSFGDEAPAGISGTQELRWQNEGYVYRISQYCDKGISLNLACPETALLLEKYDYTAMQDLTLEQEMWIAGFESEDKSVSILLYPGSYGKWMLENYQWAYGYIVVCEEGDFDYYAMSEEYLSKNPDHYSIAWNTTIGAVFVRGRIDDENGNVSADVWDFVNADLARSITEQLGAEFMPLP